MKGTETEPNLEPMERNQLDVQLYYIPTSVLQFPYFRFRTSISTLALLQIIKEYAPVMSNHQSDHVSELQVTVVTVRKQSGHNMYTAYTNLNEVI